MIPTQIVPYNDGEIRIGWASWDHGRYKERSIKWAYPDKSGKVSRGAPEVSFDILAEMFLTAYKHGELGGVWNTLPQKSPADPMLAAEMRKDALREERKKLSLGFIMLQRLMDDFPWVDWKEAYNQLATRLNEVDAAL